MCVCVCVCVCVCMYVSVYVHLCLCAVSNHSYVTMHTSLIPKPVTLNCGYKEFLYLGKKAS